MHGMVRAWLRAKTFTYFNCILYPTPLLLGSDHYYRRADDMAKMGNEYDNYNRSW